MKQPRSHKSQSAVEYLTTYGWMLIILIIVIAVLYSLGVFGGGLSTGSRAQPGSCQVARPNGAGTISNIALVGACNNEIPEYVANFNGQTSNILLNPIAYQTGNVQAITISFWISPVGFTGSSFNYIISGCSPKKGNNGPWSAIIDGGQIVLGINTTGYGNVDYGLAKSPTASKWQHVVLVYNGLPTFYINDIGATGSSFQSSIYGVSNAIAIGIPCPSIGSPTYAYQGRIANIQLYNAAMTMNQVSALYSEGIGGAPVDLPNLIGWWPLNGNPNDYSGNGATINAISGITYTSQWTANYTAP